MRWKIEAQGAGRSWKTGVSDIGWRRRSAFIEAARLPWSEEESVTFVDLGHLAINWQVQWTRDLDVDFPENWGDSAIAGKLSGGLELQQMLRVCLADIGKVAAKKGYAPPARPGAGSWPLKGGELEVYFLRPASARGDGTTKDYQRVSFLLTTNGQSGRQAQHFYQWSLVNTDPTKLDVRRPKDESQTSPSYMTQWNISHMEQIHNKVWVVSNADGQKAVLKLERAATVNRYQSIHFLAKHTFEGIPITEIADDRDVNTIRSMKRAQRFTQGAPFAEAKNDPFEELTSVLPVAGDGWILCKIEYKILRPDLKSKIEALAPLPDPVALRAVHESFFVGKNFVRLGKMAMFDHVTSNHDRLVLTRKIRGPGYTLGFQNFDFDEAGRPYALDNYDPVTGWIIGQWAEREAIGSPGRIAQYTTRALDVLIRETHADAFVADKRQELERCFTEGMAKGKRALLAFLGPHGKMLKESYGPQGQELHRRIELLRHDLP